MILLQLLDPWDVRHRTLQEGHWERTFVSGLALLQLLVRLDLFREFEVVVLVVELVKQLNILKHLALLAPVDDQEEVARVTEKPGCEHQHDAEE